MAPSYCLAVLAAAVAGPASAASGWEAYEEGRYADAVGIWRDAAARGDADAQFGLGTAYDLGHGVQADPLTACRWYASAGEAGHVVAAFNTAVMHDSIRCGLRQADLAARWYARAAAVGFPRAQSALAQMYATGDGVPRNPDHAAAWYRAAAANGVAAAVGRASPPSVPPASGPMLPVIPTDPDNARVLAGGDVPVVLVWSAPAQPTPARFFVEVVTLEPSGPREVVGRYVDVSATQVSLPAASASYAWRVLSVGVSPARYTVGPWRGFMVEPVRP